LAKIIELLSEDVPKDGHGRYYLLLDRLDEKWVEDVLKYRLIRALVESLKGFRKIRCLKIIVALRTDVLERVVQETKDSGFQREKYDDYIVQLSWSKTELRSFISDRLRLLVKRKYSGKTVTLNDIFSRKVDNSDPFEYMIARTLYRPRGLLAFYNQVLQRAAGKPEVSAGDIKDSEREYSRKRYQALIEEWSTAFPFMQILLEFIGSQKGRFEIVELAKRDVAEELVLRIWGDESNKLDPLYPAAERIANSQSASAYLGFMADVASTLYRVGAVGVKLRPSDRLMWSHFDSPIIGSSEITASARLQIHPMLARALLADTNQ
jgi:hypothetical protein